MCPRRFATKPPVRASVKEQLSTGLVLRRSAEAAAAIKKRSCVERLPSDRQTRGRAAPSLCPSPSTRHSDTCHRRTESARASRAEGCPYVSLGELQAGALLALRTNSSRWHSRRGRTACTSPSTAGSRRLEAPAAFGRGCRASRPQAPCPRVSKNRFSGSRARRRPLGAQYRCRRAG